MFRLGSGNRAWSASGEHSNEWPFEEAGGLREIESGKTDTQCVFRESWYRIMLSMASRSWLRCCDAIRRRNSILASLSRVGHILGCRMPRTKGENGDRRQSAISRRERARTRGVRDGKSARDQQVLGRNEGLGRKGSKYGGGYFNVYKVTLGWATVHGRRRSRERWAGTNVVRGFGPIIHAAGSCSASSNHERLYFLLLTIHLLLPTS